jgi:hypothetical protein
MLIMDYNNYIEALRQFKAEGLLPSKEYLRIGNEKYKIVGHLAPNLWKVIMSHRYILPSRIQSDYVNQEVCDMLLLDFLMAYSAGALPNDDDVTHVSYINVLRALEFARPTYYIERALAEALLRTDVPLDLGTEDIHWIYPQFRIYLPNNLISINRRGKANPAMFIDLCNVDSDAVYRMPFSFRQELRMLGGWYFPEHKVPKESLIMNTQLHFDSEEGLIAYAVTVPWEGTTMREMINIGNEYNLMSGLPNDELDHEFMARVLCLAINIMLRLSSLPNEAQAYLKAETKVIRKPKEEGKRRIAGLYAARIIGMDEAKRPTKPMVPAVPTGKHLVAHWRRGHWRRQAYGPKAGLRRFQWIAPYHTYEHEEKR